MGTCLRIPKVNIDRTIGTVSRVSDESRVTSKDKVLMERAMSQHPFDTIQQNSVSTSIVLKERNIDDTNVRCRSGKTDVHGIGLEDLHSKAVDDIERRWVWNLSRGNRVPAISSGHSK